MIFVTRQGRSLRRYETKVLIQPLVTRSEDGSELIAGERRWRDALLRNKAAAGSVAQKTGRQSIQKDKHQIFLVPAKT